ncbi:MAG: CBS domain-containing protein [Nitrosopumilaceae archaeon]
MITETIYEHFKDIYNSNVASLISSAIEIKPTFTVSQVINEISKNNVYDVFCLDGGSVLTTNVRTLLKAKDIDDMNIRSFLTPISSLTRNDLIQKAANIIAINRIRAVPVVENNKIIGCVTSKNIIELLSKKDNKWIKANLILSSNPITIKSSETLGTARKLMLSKKIDHLPVIDKNTISQVLTSFHVLQTINPLERLGNRSRGMKKVGKFEGKIRNIGSTRIPQCTPGDDLNTIIQRMLNTDTTCCLVSLWDKLQGIITYRDILSLLASKIESEIPLYIVGLPEEQKNVDLISNKFSDTLKRIRSVYSEIQEAKIIIKKHRTGSNKRKEGMYEVSIMITTPHYAPFIFKENGWDLGKVFEILSQKMRRQLSKRAKKRNKPSIRKLETPGLIEPI